MCEEITVPFTGKGTSFRKVQGSEHQALSVDCGGTTENKDAREILGVGKSCDV